MAGSTLFGSGLVKKDILASDRFHEFVAGVATHILVGTSQGEGCALLMVEQGWLPARAVVAVRAGSDMGRIDELRSMSVLVAFLAFHRGCLEVHIGKIGFHSSGLVTVDASRGSMSTEERKVSFRVVKSPQVLPVRGGMASLTSRRSPVRPHLPHTLRELAFVRVLMADGAGSVVELVQNDLLELRRGAFLMAIGTGGREMSPRERKAGLLMLRQRECRGMIALQVMALLAAVEIGRGGKLALMIVLMAVHAFGELDLVERVLALRNMTAGALHFRVLEFQRIL